MKIILTDSNVRTVFNAGIRLHDSFRTHHLVLPTVQNPKIYYHVKPRKAEKISHLTTWNHQIFGLCLDFAGSHGGQCVFPSTRLFMCIFSLRLYILILSIFSLNSAFLPFYLFFPYGTPTCY